MISYLKGKILNKTQNCVIINVSDIGYKVFINPIMLANFNIGQELEVYTHHRVKEDASDLYGFKSLEELEMFELLLSISGIGPKSAMGVLAIAGVSDIKQSIASGDSGLLVKVSGIGKKTAERVVLELRGKIGVLENKENKSEENFSVSGDEIDALMVLGYSMSQARDALKNVDTNIKNSGERIKSALKKLCK